MTFKFHPVNPYVSMEDGPVTITEHGTYVRETVVKMGHLLFLHWKVIKLLAILQAAQTALIIYLLFR